MADEQKTLSIDVDCGEVDSVEKWQELKNEAFAKILFERIKFANSCGLFRKQDLDGIFEVCKSDAKVFHRFELEVTRKLMQPYEEEAAKKEALLSSWKYPVFMSAFGFVPAIAVEVFLIRVFGLPAPFVAGNVTLFWIVLMLVFELPKRAFLKLFS